MKLSELLAWARDPTPFLFEIVYTLKPLIEDTFVGIKIACRHCSNYIFILDLTSGFNGFGKDNCKTRHI